MGEVYTGRVVYVTDPESGKGSYRAAPDVEWEDTGDPTKNGPHPDGQLTSEDLLSFPTVVWISEPDTLEEVDLEPQTVSLKEYLAGGDQVEIRETSPPDQEGFTDLGDGTFGYTFGARKTKTGGGHFELA